MKRPQVDRILMLCILLSITSSSCRHKLPSELQPKLLISQSGSYDQQSFSQNGQSMVFGFTPHNYVTYIRDVDDLASAMKIDLPLFEEGNAGYFEDLCLADEIWVTTPLGQIASYNTNAETWTIHPRINSRMETYCHVLFDNNVVIFSNNQIAIYQEGWKYYELPYRGVIAAAHNSQNQVFAITFLGNLFVLEKDSWQELPIGLGEVRICNYCFGISADNILWLADLDGIVFTWDPSANTAPREFVLELGQEEYEFIQDLFIGPRGQVWINTTDGIWLIENDKLQKITYPKEDYLVPYVEPTKGRFYFDNIISIDYYDLDDLTGE